MKIILPPYSGLGVYGGIITGTIAAWWYARRRQVSFARWADIVAPALFVMQAIGRWGNYFNQELYGPPTTLPWGIPIDCAHRLQDVYSCALLPGGHDALPPAVPVRVDLGDRSARSSCTGSGRVPRAAAARRPAAGLLHLVRDDAVPAREPARGQLDVLRHPDGADRVARRSSLVGVGGLIHRHRPRHPADRPPTFPDQSDVGRPRRDMDDQADRRAVGERAADREERRRRLRTNRRRCRRRTTMTSSRRRRRRRREPTP